MLLKSPFRMGTHFTPDAGGDSYWYLIEMSLLRKLASVKEGASYTFTLPQWEETCIQCS